MQPRHAAPEFVEKWRTNVGPERERYAWPLRSLHQAGAVLAFSSDWNVAEMDPMVWLHAAVTRASLEGDHRWLPEERVDLETAVRATTMGGAYANFCEGNRGSITPGKYADLILLSQDIFAIPTEGLLETTVDLTMICGEVRRREF